MLIRTKGGEFRADTSSVLLDFLGVKKEAAGVQKLAGDLELIAAVPFCLALDSENSNGIPWTFSTFDLDRFDERIDPAGWDFKRYVQNPVIEWAHCYSIPAIGKADGLYADDKGLHGSIIFNGKDYDPFGWAIGERVKNGVIRAGSVGFRVLEVEIPSKKDGEDGTALIFRKQELLEFSVCNVPANPFALANPVLTKAAPAEPGPVSLDLQASRQFWAGLIQG
ncbi:caudovirus prohead protease [Treponema primitia ZAS-2]|uniref:Caudovirus prohead protease n=1 Tax=Treponema primitia (strain ATCC BAA-887 / DSM 12427 / ZAS-2) TaxID=545694 RepID=F5YJQ7_TREPZ|nr:HK97 family phage prohead protease [Treponema primitia]AEF83892.1 caudovirus prohead protease [Treponema primitia ZAS-2]